MRSWNWDRIAAGAGVGMVVLFVVGYLIVGDGPKVDDPAGEILSYYGDERGKIATGAIIFGLGGVLLLWFVSALATALRAAGEPRAAATALAGGVTMVGVLFMILTVDAGIMLAAQEGADEGAVLALHKIFWAAEVVIAWPAAVLVGATAAAALRTRIFPQWYAGASGMAALAFLLGGTTWARDGFWAPDGAYGLLAFLVFLTWTLVTSVLLVRRAPVAELPHTATATA